MHPLVKDVQKTQLKKIPEVRTGYTVRVHQKIKEGGKERVQAFEGLVIKMGHGEGAEKTITVRKIVQGIGVEKVFPIHSPNITKIEVKKKAKVRRSKLYYMRQRSGKSARLQERHVTDAERAEEEAKMEAFIQEAVKAEEKRKKEEEEVKAKEEGETAEASPDQPSDKPEKEASASEAEPETPAEPEEPAADEGPAPSEAEREEVVKDKPASDETEPEEDKDKPAE